MMNTIYDEHQSTHKSDKSILVMTDCEQEALARIGIGHQICHKKCVSVQK